MAELAGVRIADKNSALDCGGAFLLLQKCNLSESVQMEGGWEVEIAPDSPYVVVRGTGAHDSLSAYEIAHEKAQQGLDILSMKNIAHFSIQNAEEEYLIWWREVSGQILRLVATNTFNFSVSGTLAVTDESDNIVPPQPQPPIEYHYAFRYFRLAQITDDLFDAYRNMWLAFELLLSSRYPIQKQPKTETERNWLERCLREVEAIDPQLFSGLFPSRDQDVRETALRVLYKEVRNPLFHSKEDYYIPHSLQERHKVREALGKLSYLVIWLLNIGSHGSQLNPETFDVATRQVLLVNTQIFVADYDESLILDDTPNDLRNASIRPMTTDHDTQSSRPGLQYIRGVISQEELDGLDKIRRYGLRNTKTNQWLAEGYPDAPLTCDNIDRLEIAVGLRLNNSKMPKTFYKS